MLKKWALSLIKLFFYRSSSTKIQGILDANSG